MSEVNALLLKFRRGLAERRDLSLGELLGRIWRAGRAMRNARAHLVACTSVGARARIVGAAPLIENLGELTIGDDVTLNCEIVPVQLDVARGGLLAIGHAVSLNFGVVITSRTSVRLGNRVRVGPYGIVTDTDVPLPGMDTARAESIVHADPVVIGDDVWLGARVTVLAGSRIGNGSIIGAGSVVCGEIPAGVLAGGVPARVIRPIPGLGT